MYFFFGECKPLKKNPQDSYLFIFNGFSRRFLRYLPDGESSEMCLNNRISKWCRIAIGRLLVEGDLGYELYGFIYSIQQHTHIHNVVSLMIFD